MVRVTMSWRTLETVPSALLGGGGGDSPGALDANFRHQVNFQPIPLTWRESTGGLKHQWLLSDAQVRVALTL